MSDEYVQIGAVRVKRERVRPFKGKLLRVEDDRGGWSWLTVEGLDHPLLVSRNRASELRKGDEVEGLYDPVLHSVWRVSKAQGIDAGVGL